ncbi:MAG: hypothetical protein FWC05_02260 [Treponema sp.]|nr:hypothetical protein [Treponema sp.]
MKNKFLFVFLFLIVLSVYGQTRGTVSLDDAIHNSAQRIQDGLENRSTVIVYQFLSQNRRLSDYILNELFNFLVNSNKFIVLDRGSRDVVNAELDFQFNQSAGMISDDSLASLTRRIGAQAIITGSLDDTGDEYRFRIRVIGTETTAAIVSYVVRINKNDRRITAFTGRERSAGEKAGTGALNIILGLGSYIERDISGGITITTGYIVSAGLIYIEATMLDWDSPFVGIPATVGAVTLGLTIVYGFVRPFIYKRSPGLTYIFDNTQIGIVYPANNFYLNNNMGFQITHTIRY